jgi:hypothetical protein
VVELRGQLRERRLVATHDLDGDPLDVLAQPGADHGPRRGPDAAAPTAHPRDDTLLRVLELDGGVLALDDPPPPSEPLADLLGVAVDVLGEGDDRRTVLVVDPEAGEVVGRLTLGPGPHLPEQRALLTGERVGAVLDREVRVHVRGGERRVRGGLLLRRGS